MASRAVVPRRTVTPKTCCASGRAYTISMCMSVSAAIKLIGTLHERVHHGVRDVTEHGAGEFLKQSAGKFVAKAKVDTAGLLAQGCKEPLAVQHAKRPFDQA